LLRHRQPGRGTAWFSAWPAWWPPCPSSCSLGLLGGLVALILGAIAVTRGRAKGTTNRGQAIAGIVCGALAFVIAIVFAVRFGTFVARNTNVFTRFDNCIAKAGNRSAVSNCIARLANDIRP
jgi:cytochrome bd-type quinol oxidase subunit 2